VARLESLARVLKEDVQTIMARVAEKPLPAKLQPQNETVAAFDAYKTTPAQSSDVLEDLYSAIARVRQKLPGLKVTLTITSNEER
jgi:hypothetical protein